MKPASEPKAPIMFGAGRKCAACKRQAIRRLPSDERGTESKCLYCVNPTLIQSHHVRWWFGLLTTCDRWGYEGRNSTILTIKELQEWRCALCKREAELVVDHDHYNGAIRGMLCSSCNSGSLMDRPGLAVASVKYIACSNEHVLKTFESQRELYEQTYTPDWISLQLVDDLEIEKPIPAIDRQARRLVMTHRNVRLSMRRHRHEPRDNTQGSNSKT